MSIEIEFESTFRKIFSEGMNLFLGAGFPVLAKDPESRTIPTGRELSNELKVLFDLEEFDSLTLPQLCTIL
jgi:hypothetical protein